MCFSAGASFGVSALLFGAGIVAIKKIESPKILALACTPFLFGMHQLSEGILWLTLSDPELISMQSAATYFYVFFAQITWPLWVPYTVWLMEPDKARKKIIFYIMLIGVAFSAYQVYWLLEYKISAVIESGHMRYNLYYPFPRSRRILYALTALVPVLLSSVRFMKLLGLAFVASYIISYILYREYVISVWCFFAAILSALILVVIAYNKESVIKPSLT